MILSKHITIQYVCGSIISRYVTGGLVGIVVTDLKKEFYPNTFRLIVDYWHYLL